MKKPVFVWTIVICLLPMLSLIGSPKPEAIKKVVSAKKVEAAIARHLRTLGEYLSAEKNFDDNLTRDKIKAKAGAIAVLAQAGLDHPDSNQEKMSAAYVREAAQKIAEAEDYDAAKTAFEEVKAAVGGKPLMNEVSRKEDWYELVSMENLMEELNYLQGDLKRTVRRSRDPEGDALDATTAALLSLTLQANLDYAFDEEEEQEWTKYAQQMQAEYQAIAEAILAKDTDAAREHHKLAAESCTACHDKFREQ